MHKPGPQDLSGRRAKAIAGAKRVVAALGRKQVTALITGSLADGSFHLHSDVDFLIVECPRNMKYALESVVEDAIGDLPFDIVYLDEVDPGRRRNFKQKALRAEELD